MAYHPARRLELSLGPLSRRQIDDLHREYLVLEMRAEIAPTAETFNKMRKVETELENLRKLSRPAAATKDRQYDPSVA